jgi:hypothetical protein
VQSLTGSSGAPAADPYNSLAHALRVVAGRWETGPDGLEVQGHPTSFLFGPDPACSGATANQLLMKAYGKDFSARRGLRDVTCACQETASKLIEGAGIVLPESAINNASFQPVRDAVLDQLVTTAAVKNGYSPGDATFRNELQGRTIRETFQLIGDEDLRFALLQANQVYRLLTGLPEATASVAVTPLLAPAEQRSALLEGQGGMVLGEGLPKLDTTVDMMARAGGIQEASQCDSLEGARGMLAADSSIAGARMAFQDSFAMGQSLLRRLVKLRDRAREAGLTESGAAVELISGAAAGETRTWAGEGRLVAEVKGGRIKTIRLYAVGFEPEDFGVFTADQMKDQLVLVYGEPWVADCAARLRKACPADFERDYVLAPTSAQVVSLNGDAGEARAYRRELGSFGTYMWLDFPMSASNFDPRLLGETSLPQDKHVYVVQRHDPNKPSGSGKVMGALALRVKNGATTVMVSNVQREYVNRILGIHPSWGTSGPSIGKRTASFSRGYCLEGVPPDLFVPLENELTSDSDQYESSWRHYLTLAKQAAQKADELGQKLIEIGLQQDYRREASMQKVAEVCGEYGLIDDATVENGQVSARATSKDSPLGQCLSEKKVDIVFLTEDQSTNGLHTDKNKTAQDFLKRDVLGCGTVQAPANTTHPLCKVTTDPKTNKEMEITSAGLNLSNERQVVKPTSCDEAISLVGSMPSGFAGPALDSVSTAPWVRSDSLNALARMLKLESYRTSANDEEYWRLTFGGTVVMDSRPVETVLFPPDAGAKAVLGLWPGCDRPVYQMITVPCDFAHNPLADFWSRLFHKGAQGSAQFVEDGVASAHLEAALIRWRVEGALWLIGSMAGVVPAGMFTKEIPAVNFAWDSSGWDSTKSANALTVYGQGRFGAAQDGAYWLAPPESDKDQNALGAAILLPSSFGYPQTGEVPAFIQETIYEHSTHPSSTTGTVLHVRAVSDEARPRRTTEAATSKFLHDVAAGLDGARCEQYSGLANGEQIDALSFSAAADLVASMRGLQTAVRSIGLVSAVGRGRNARRVASTR